MTKYHKHEYSEEAWQLVQDLLNIDEIDDVLYEQHRLLSDRVSTLYKYFTLIRSVNSETQDGLLELIQLVDKYNDMVHEITKAFHEMRTFCQNNGETYSHLKELEALIKMEYSLNHGKY